MLNCFIVCCIQNCCTIPTALCLEYNPYNNNVSDKQTGFFTKGKRTEGTTQTKLFTSCIFLYDEIAPGQFSPNSQELPPETAVATVSKDNTFTGRDNASATHVQQNPGWGDVVCHSSGFHRFWLNCKHDKRINNFHICSQ